MIQTLQKKVVVTAMAAVTVLLLFLLGAINVANMLIVERQVDRTLRIISDSEAGGIPPRSDGAPPLWRHLRMTMIRFSPPTFLWCALTGWEIS